MPKRDRSARSKSTYKEVARENELFSRYYQKNQVTCDDAEWGQFLAACRSDLPTTFRITDSDAGLDVARQWRRNFLPNFEEAAGVASIDWYPKQLAWTLPENRTAVRSSESYKELHRFLVLHTELGNISRQEAVSMLPPLYLQVQPGDVVLDMCAAPGSKTAQLIESLHSGCEGKLAQGLVVANDADNERCYTLTHQAKRLQSPLLVVTNHDASIYPNIHFLQEEKIHALQYDRVLCDVPCSGDGTMRKNVLVWQNWNAMQGNGLHTIQSRILERAIQLAKEGGRIVYSTCSLNPVENEAVVASALLRFPDRIRLADVSACLPALKYRPGMRKWFVMDKAGAFYESIDQIPPEYREKFKETMFYRQEMNELPLERCLRIHPHLQNTGGFFLAVFEKISTSGACEISSVPRAPRFQGYREKPFLRCEDAGASYEQVIEQICASFPLHSLPTDQYFVRSEAEAKDTSKTLYFGSGWLPKILAAGKERNSSLKIINAGIKAVSKNDSFSGDASCPYRLHYEFLRYCFSMQLPPESDRCIRIEASDAGLCVSKEPISVSELQCAPKLASKPMGCLIFAFEERTPIGSRLSICFPVWLGRSTVIVYLAAAEKQAFLFRLLFHHSETSFSKGNLEIVDHCL